MQNFDQVKKAQDALNQNKQFGSAFKENEKYVQSLAGQLNKLKEIWINVFQTLVSSSTFGGLLQGIITVSEAIETLIVTLDKAKLLTPVIGLLFASFATSKLKNITGFGSVLGGLTSAFGLFGRGAATTAAAAGGVASAAGAFIGPPTRGAALLTSGLTALSGMALPLLGLAGALTAVTVGASLYNKNFGVKARASDIQKNISDRQAEIDVINNQKKSLSGIQEEYDKLSSKPKKTADEVQRLKELTNELVKIKPDLKIGTDKDNNAIIGYTGKIKDLIRELDGLENRKVKSQNVNKRELAINSIEQLSGSGGSGLAAQSQSTLMGSLETETSKHVDNMGKLEKKRDNLLNKMMQQTGIERQKTYAEVQKIDDKMFQEQNRFQSEYTKVLENVKNKNAKLGTGIFADLQNNSAFKGASAGKQNAFMELKKSLDFTDIKSEDQMIKVENGLANIMKTASDGKINLTELKKNLDGVNQEFSKTGNVNKYNASMDKLASEISKVSGVDKGTVMSLFQGIDTSALKTKSSLDKFLASYGKSAGDISNNDRFAIALAEQKRKIDDGISNIQEALSSDDLEVQKQVAFDLIGDDSLPEELRDMIRTLMNKGADTSEVLKFSQKLMMDISEGDLNIDEANKQIEQKFGKGSFKITPKMLLNPQAQVAGVETVIKQLTDKFGELPATVTTVIKADGVTSYNEAMKIKTMYDSFPKEIQTLIHNNGLETTKDLNIVDQLYKNFPPEVVTNILANSSEAISSSTSYKEALQGIPTSVLTNVTLNTNEAGFNLGALANQLDNLNLDKTISINVVKGLAEGNIEQVAGAIDSLPSEKRIAVMSNIVNAMSGISAVDKKKLKDKIAKLNANNRPAMSMIQAVNNTKMKDKKTNVSAPGASGVISNLNTIKSMKDKTVTVSIIQRVKQIGAAIGNFFKGTGSGNVSKSVLQPTVSDNIQAPISPSPAPMSTGATPVSTGSTPNVSTVSSSPAPMSTGASSNDISIGNIMPSYDFDINILSVMESELKKINNQLDILDKKSKNAFGQDKINLLNKQNELYRQQQKIQHELAESMRKQQNELRYTLGRKEFTFNSDGEVTNYNEKLLEKEKYVKSLEDRVSADKDNTNEGLKKHYEEAKKELETSKKYLGEYLDLTNSGIPDASSKWMELQTKIEEYKLEIIKASYELSNINVDIKIDKFDNKVKKIQNELDILEYKINNTNGSEKSGFIEKRIELFKKEQAELHNLANSYREQSDIRKDLLTKNGFIFDASGTIQNEEMLSSYKGTALFDYLKDNIKEYNDLVNDKIPSLSENWLKLESSIKESYKDQLKLAKDMQDKVTEMYRKELEEKKKIIDKETSLQTEALQKRKEAYNESRKQDDYKESLTEQQNVINELQSKIDNASRDNSQTGQKRLQDLAKQMKDEQEKLKDIVQNNLDESVNSMYDKESDRIKENADKIKENLDNVYSDENIKTLVDKAISSGVFVDLDGNIKTLQDSMVEFTNKFGDGMTAIGGLINSELIGNLEIAKKTINELGNINDLLGLSKYASQSTMSFQSNNSMLYSQSKPNDVRVEFNQPLITVNGNVDKDMIPVLEQMIKKAKNEITDEIVKKVH